MGEPECPLCGTVGGLSACVAATAANKKAHVRKCKSCKHDYRKEPKDEK